MTQATEDLVALCRCIRESKTITEKRRLLEALNLQLDNSFLLKTLDDNTINGEGLQWPAIVGVVLGQYQSEVHRWQKSPTSRLPSLSDLDNVLLKADSRYSSTRVWMLADCDGTTVSSAANVLLKYFEHPKDNARLLKKVGHDLLRTLLRRVLCVDVYAAKMARRQVAAVIAYITDLIKLADDGTDDIAYDVSGSLDGMKEPFLQFVAWTLSSSPARLRERILHYRDLFITLEQFLADCLGVLSGMHAQRHNGYTNAVRGILAALHAFAIQSAKRSHGSVVSFLGGHIQAIIALVDSAASSVAVLAVELLNILMMSGQCVFGASPRPPLLRTVYAKMAAFLASKTLPNSAQVPSDWLPVLMLATDSWYLAMRHPSHSPKEQPPNFYTACTQALYQPRNEHQLVICSAMLQTHRGTLWEHCNAPAVLALLAALETRLSQSNASALWATVCLKELAASTAIAPTSALVEAVQSSSLWVSVSKSLLQRLHEARGSENMKIVLYEALLAIHTLQAESVNLFGVVAMALDQKSIRHSEADCQFTLQVLARCSLTPELIRVFGSFVLRCFLEFGGFPRIVDLITCQLEEPPRFRLTKRAHDSIWQLALLLSSCCLSSPAPTILTASAVAPSSQQDLSTPGSPALRELKDFYTLKGFLARDGSDSTGLDNAVRQAQVVDFRLGVLLTELSNTSHALLGRMTAEEPDLIALAIVLSRALGTCLQTVSVLFEQDPAGVGRNLGAGLGGTGVKGARSFMRLLEEQVDGLCQLLKQLSPAQLITTDGRYLLQGVLAIFVQDVHGFVQWRQEYQPLIPDHRFSSLAWVKVKALLHGNVQVAQCMQSLIHTIALLFEDVVASKHEGEVRTQATQATQATTTPVAMDELDDLEFEAPVRGGRASTSDAVDNRRTLIAPRHATEEAQACLLDVLHAWRGLTLDAPHTCLHDDEGAKVMIDAGLNDDEAPLYIALCCCQSLAKVATRSPAHRGAHAIKLIKTLCIGELALFEESGTSYFNTILHLVCLAVPNFLLVTGSPAATPQQRQLLDAFLSFVQERYLEYHPAYDRLLFKSTTLEPSQRYTLLNLVCTLIATRSDLPWLCKRVARGQGTQDVPLSPLEVLREVAWGTRDLDAMVRLNMATALPALLTRLDSALQAQLLQQVDLALAPCFSADLEDPILEALHRGDETPEMIKRWFDEVRVVTMTALMTLSKLCPVAPSFEKRYLFLLLKQARSKLHKLVSAVLSNLAKELRFRDTSHMLDSCRVFLLNEWLHDPDKMHDPSHSEPLLVTPFFAIPYWLFDPTLEAKGKARERPLDARHLDDGKPLRKFFDEYVSEHVASFCKRYQQDLLIVILFSESIDIAVSKLMLMALSEVVRTTLPDMLQEAYPRIAAMVYAYSSGRGAIVAEEIAKLMGVDEAKPRAIIKAQRRTFVREFVRLAVVMADDRQTGVQAEPFWLPETQVKEMLVTRLGKQSKVLGQLLLHEQALAVDIVMDVVRELEVQRRDSELLRCLRKLHFVVFDVLDHQGFLFEHKGAQVYHQDVFAITITAAQRAMMNSLAAVDTATRLLAGLLDGIYRLSPSWLESFSASTMPQLAENLTQVLLTGDISTSTSRAAVSLLAMVVLGHTSAGEPVESLANGVCKRLDVIPAHPALSELRGAQQATRTQGSLETAVQDFIGLSQSLPNGTRSSGIQHLLELARLEPTALSPDSRRRLTVELLRIAKQHGDRVDLSLLVAKLLGTLGCMDFDAVAMPTDNMEQCDANSTKAQLHVLIKTLSLMGDASANLSSTCLTCLKLALHRDNLLEDIHAINPAMKARLETCLRYTSPAHTLEQLPSFPTSRLLRNQCDLDLRLPSEAAKLAEEQLQHSIHLWRVDVPDSNAWLVRLVTTLIEGSYIDEQQEFGFWKAFLGLCYKSVSFSRALLPYIVMAKLLADISGKIAEKLAKCITEALDNASKAPTTANIAAMRELLRLVDVLCRTPRPLSTTSWQHKPKRSKRTNYDKKLTQWDCFNWLQLDYGVVAQAARLCEADFSCLYYAEVALEKRHLEPLLKAQAQTTTYNNNTVSHYPPSGNMQALMCDAYQRIGEHDSFDALFNPLNLASQMAYYSHQQRFGETIGVHDLMMAEARIAMPSADLQAFQEGLAHTMQGLGQYDNASQFLLGMNSAETQELQAQAAWRQQFWSQDVALPSGALATNELSDPNRYDPTQCFNRSILRLLHATNAADLKVVHQLVQAARAGIVKTLTSSTLESTQQTLAPLSQLQALQEVAELAQTRLEMGMNTSEDSASAFDGDCTTFSRVKDVWDKRAGVMTEEFSARDLVHATRVALLEIELKRSDHDSSEVAQVLVCELQHFATLARDSDQYHQSQRLTQRLKFYHQRLALPGSDSWLLEEARNHWANSQPELAIRMLETSMSVGSQSVQTKAQTRAQLGTWLGNLQLKSPEEVIDSYFNTAIDELKEKSHGFSEQHLAAATLALAQYADEQFVNISTKLESTDIAEHERLISAEEAHLVALSTGKEDRKLNRKKARARKEKQTIEKLRSDRKFLLETAISTYVEVLQYRDQQQEAVFRLCSLWFDNHGQVNETVSNAYARIPAHVWIPMAYQLSSRLEDRDTTQSPDFQQLLKRVFTQMCAKHRHHTIWKLLLVSSKAKDGSVSTRQKAAQGILQDLKQSKELTNYIVDCERLQAAYVDLAEKKFNNINEFIEEQRGKFKLCKLKNLTRVGVLTCAVDVQPDGNYDNKFVSIASWDTSFEIVQGVSKPRALNCYGSDGKAYKQLAKGGDDTRQDALMLQVFESFNRWLKTDTKCRRRRLNADTYFVLPLTQNVGVIEWVPDTIALGQYLTGHDTGAHARYKLGSLTPKECRAQMSVDPKSSLETRVTALRNVFKGLPPVFRRFFTERFRDPSEWFERRLAYTQSVAVNSMLGYVIGLGDRHPNNVLLHTKTAKMIAIDFGVVFDLGKHLPTPETVPFRLTRDVVDGMGVAGVEGVFRKCCELSLERLKLSKSSVLTVLEVLLFDPLSDWRLAFAKKSKQQQKEEGSMSATNDLPALDQVEAKRCLRQIREKLQGVHNSVQLGTAGHVGMLIQEAQDIRNLAALFQGWQAWL